MVVAERAWLACAECWCVHGWNFRAASMAASSVGP
jgi:hypothetical protein